MAPRSPGVQNPLWGYPQAYVPVEQKDALRDYLEYTAWKRQQLQHLMGLYRKQFPKQIDAYRKAALGELNMRAPELWGQMHTNLQKRGLDESQNFVAGAKQEHAKWRLGERQAIEETANNMKAQAQQMMLAAVGQPNFGGVYQGWTNLGQQLNQYFDSIMRKAKLGPYGEEEEET